MIVNRPYKDTDSAYQSTRMRSNALTRLESLRNAWINGPLDIRLRSAVGC